MPTAAVLPCSVRGLLQLGFASLIAGAALLPIACSDHVPRGIPASGAATKVEEPEREAAPGCPAPRIPSWILVQLRNCVVLPADCHPAEGLPDALLTIFASLESDPWRDLAQPREFAIVVPSTTALHGIEIVVRTCEVQVDLGAASCVDGTVAHDPLGLTLAPDGPWRSSLHILLPRP